MSTGASSTVAPAAVRRRLDGYWKMELANVALVPTFCVWLAAEAGSPVSWLAAGCLVPTCGLLAVGGVYWRAKARAAGGDRSALPAALRLARACRVPLLILTAAAAGASAADLAGAPLSAGTGDAVAAAVAAVLAVSEYVNYYHRQLQHFDNAADFRRLMRGEGFRVAHLRADLDRPARRG